MYIIYWIGRSTVLKIAVIGGTGVYNPEVMQDAQEKKVSTPYGNVSFLHGQYKDKEVYFLARHGSKHSLPPHKINYRANIWALKGEGIEKIISTAAVGSMNIDMKPGSVVLIDQFIDFTRQRPITFFDGEHNEVVHTDFTEPYCPQLKEIIAEAGKNYKFDITNKGTYVCSEGPRFETSAEIKMFRSLGADLAGMTNVPEVVLARELGFCYATICFVTNYAAGISEDILTHEEVLEMMGNNIADIRSLIMDAVVLIQGKTTCHCQNKPGRIIVDK